MRVERRRDAERDIAYLLKALDTVVKDEICQRYISCCDCPLCDLGVFDVPNCREIAKLKSRLKLAYKVVETL